MYTNNPELNNFIKTIDDTLRGNDINKIKDAININNFMPTEKINLLFTGSTLCGKSTTIERLEKEANKQLGIQYPSNHYPAINHTPFPTLCSVDSGEKNSIITRCHEVRNLTCWETLGFGLSQESDRHILNQIKKKMDTPTQSAYSNYLIDLTIIIHDYSFNDWRTTYNICNNLNYGQRILLAINQKEAPSSDNEFSPEIPPILEDMCNKKNIEIVYYNSHDEVSVRCLLFSIIALIKTRDKVYPLFIIKDENKPLKNTNHASFCNSSFNFQLRTGEKNWGFTVVMDAICDTFALFDTALSISNDFNVLQSIPNPANKALTFTHLVLTILTVIWRKNDNIQKGKQTAQ